MGHPLFDLSGKSAVVVGGTSGIGLAMAIGRGGRRCCREFAAPGAGG
jgi:hypothetical protein